MYIGVCARIHLRKTHLSCLGTCRCLSLHIHVGVFFRNGKEVSAEVRLGAPRSLLARLRRSESQRQLSRDDEDFELLTRLREPAGHPGLLLPAQ